MGFGKKLKKAFKKVTKVVSKVGGGAIPGLGGGGGEKEKPVQQVAPEVAAPPQTLQATTEVAKKEVDEDGDADTEAAKKKARSGGKKGLSVARSSGSGLNI